MKTGFWQAIGAYGLWGLLPIYWKWLHLVSAPQVLSHRIVWSFGMLALILAGLRQWGALRAALTWRVVLVYVVAAVLLSANWLTYLWAVNTGYVVETSLGYFINPLLSVVFGVMFLREKLRRWQWLPVGLATAGVLYLTVTYGSLPWIALTLAVTFGLYGLVKKLSPLKALPGLTLETGLMFLPALGYLLYAESIGHGALGHSDLITQVLLVGAGLVTTLPLFLFTAAAQHIPLSLTGLLQYIAPTLQFLLGVWVYGEPFTANQFVGFGLVWLALIVFALESWHAQRAHPRRVAWAGD